MTNKAIFFFTRLTKITNSKQNEQSKMIKVTRINNFEYAFGESDPEHIQVVVRALTFRNPSPFAYSPVIRMYDRRRLTFRIGMLPTLQVYVKENGPGMIILDYDHQLPRVEIDPRMSGRYAYQRAAVEAFLKRRFGIIVVPTRGGKTFIASEVLRIFLATHEGNALFLTDNTTLFTQAIRDIRGYFEPYGGIEVGEIRAGAVDTSHRLTVGMIQTIQSTLSSRCTDRTRRRGLEKYLRELSFLCVDEVHDNCSSSKLRIYRRARALDYQLSLSATPYRANALVQNLRLKEWSGDVVYTITEAELRRSGVLSDYRVIMLLMEHAAPPGADYANCLSTCIHGSTVRNGVLLTVIDMLRHLGLKTLVLFQSIEHGSMVARLSGEVFISGDTCGDDRERIKARFLSGQGGVLLASNVFKKGVTLPEVEVLINADGGLESANVVQRKGRVLGATADKKRALVIDFFDLCDSYFSDHSGARLDTYVDAVGEGRVDILDPSVSGWTNILRQCIVGWFTGVGGCSGSQ